MFYNKSAQDKIGLKREGRNSVHRNLKTISQFPDLKMAEKNMWQLQNHFYCFKTTQFNWFDINIGAYLNYEQSSVLNHATFNGNSLENRLSKEHLS